MKIMFFTLSLRGGGAERVIASLSNEMIKKNEVIIVTVHNNRDYYETDKSVKRICLDKNIRNDKSKIKNKLQKISPRRVKELVRIIEDESPDVVITFLPLPSLYIMMAKRLSKKVKRIPIILSERGNPYREYKNKFIFIVMKKLFRNADGFVFQTKEAGSFYDGVIHCKTAIIANPINESFLTHKVISNRRKVIVSCGRLEKQKNHSLLIKAFADVVDIFPDYTLEIYGEGSEMGELKKLGKALGIDGKVFLRGRVDNIADKIADASVFVMPSNHEGMPNALMEAMALGIPCISTDCPVGGPRALIHNNVNGLLVEVDNRKILSDAIIRLIQDGDLASKLSRNGVESSKMYRVDAVTSQWLKLINEIKGGH